MTEGEWVACEDPKAMLQHLTNHASPRKLRLFACACCRRIAPRFTTAEYSRALEVAERHAEGQATDAEVRHASLEAHVLYEDSGVRRSNLDLAAVWAASVEADGGYPTRFAGYVFENTCRLGAQWVRGEPLSVPQQRERAELARLLRDIFGNPSRPIIFLPEWRTVTVLSLAQQMYEAGDFSAMPILADALQDAECASTDVLDHCRGTGPHVRGCWVIDLILSKDR